MNTDFYYHLRMPYIGAFYLTKYYVMKPKVGTPTSIIVDYERIFKSKEFTDKFIKFYSDQFSTSDSQLFNDIHKELGITNLIPKYGIDTSTLSDAAIKRIDDNTQLLLAKLVDAINEQAITSELCNPKKNSA